MSPATPVHPPPVPPQPVALRAGGRSARRAAQVSEAQARRAQEAAYRPADGYLAWLLNRASRTLGARMDQALDEVDLTEAQYGVLDALVHAESASSARLARAVHVTPQAMVGLVAALERKGYITRTAYPGAGRVVTAEPTDLGLEAHAIARRRVRAVERSVRRQMTDGPYQDALERLEALSASLSAD